MRRLARPLLFLGIVVIVFGLAKYHARYVADPPYDFTGSSRFAWTIAYCGLLIVAAYGTGLPDLPRTLRQSATSAVAAPVAAALGISVLQLVTGDALLPRFVVFGSVVLIVPWAMFCIALARDGRIRGRQRDRVLLVAETSEGVVASRRAGGRARASRHAAEPPHADGGTSETRLSSADRGSRRRHRRQRGRSRPGRDGRRVRGRAGSRAPRERHPGTVPLAVL